VQRIEFRSCQLALGIDAFQLSEYLVERIALITVTHGRLRHGESKTGDDLAAGKALLKQGTIELSLLDQTVDAFCTKLMYGTWKIITIEI